MYNDDFYEQGEGDDEETIQKMLEGGPFVSIFPSHSGPFLPTGLT